MVSPFDRAARRVRRIGFLLLAAFCEGCDDLAVTGKALAGALAGSFDDLSEWANDLWAAAMKAADAAND